MNHVETLHCNVSTIAHEKLQQQFIFSRLHKSFFFETPTLISTPNNYEVKDSSIPLSHPPKHLKFQQNQAYFFW